MSLFPTASTAPRVDARLPEQGKVFRFPSTKSISWTEWYTGRVFGTSVISAIKTESGLFQIVEDFRNSHPHPMPFTGVAVAGRLAEAIRQNFRSIRNAPPRFDILHSRFRFAVMSPERAKLLVHRIRREEIISRISPGTFLPWYPIDPLPSTTLVPTGIVSVYCIGRLNCEYDTECIIGPANLDGRMRVVYVGKSKHCGRKRCLRHFQAPSVSRGDETGWFSEVRTGFFMTILPCVSVREACSMERRFIRHYRPKFNVTGNPGAQGTLLSEIEQDNDSAEFDRLIGRT